MTELQDHSPSPLEALCRGSHLGPTTTRRRGPGRWAAHWTYI